MAADDRVMQALATDIRDLVRKVQRLQRRVELLSDARLPGMEGVSFVGVKGAAAWIDGEEVDLSAEQHGLLLAQVGSYGLLLSEQHGRVWCDGREVKALRRSPIQLRLLACLAMMPERPVRCDALFAAGWPKMADGDAVREEKVLVRLVAVAICRLRARLRDVGWRGEIRREGAGYMLCPPGGCVVIHRRDA